MLTNEDYSAVMVVVPIKDTCDVDFDKVAEKLGEKASSEAVNNMLNIFRNIMEREKTFKFRDDTIYIEMLAVQPQYQGQKYASKLMRELIRRCEKVDTDIFLYTNTARNESIYKHFGFNTEQYYRQEELNSDTYYMLYKTMQKRGDKV